MNVPPTEHLEFFVIGAVVILLIISYLTARTLRWRASVHHLRRPHSTGRLAVMVLGLHLYVMLASGGMLAALHGLPATGQLIVAGGLLIGVYIPPLLLAIGLLNRLLQSSPRTAEALSTSNLSLVDLGITFTGWNLAIYPSIAVLRLLF